MMHVELLGNTDIEHLSVLWSEEFEGFQPLLQRYGDTAVAFRHIGLKLWKESRFELAAKAFTAALSLKPDNASLWGELAGAYNGLADAARAEMCISKSIELDDTRAQPWVTLADLMSRRDDLGGAAHAYGRALALDATFAPSHFGLGIVFFRQKKMQEATESLREAVRLNPTDALGFTCLGHISYAQADFPTSIASFQAAADLLLLDPDSEKRAFGP
jgi:tetratricopeptide (TPR) repeat protein